MRLAATNTGSTKLGPLTGNPAGRGAVSEINRLNSEQKGVWGCVQSVAAQSAYWKPTTVRASLAPPYSASYGEGHLCG